MQQGRRSRGSARALANPPRATKGRANAQEDPGEGGESQSARVPPTGAGVLPHRDTPPTEFSPSLLEGPGVDDDLSRPPALPPESATDPTEYKGLSLRNIGRDPKTGKTIPHKRSEKVARQIGIWVAGGYGINDIALRLNIRPGLLKQHYAVELAVGAEQVGMDMTSHIVARAKKSDRMAIFYAKSRMNWKDGEGTQTDVSPLNIHIHA